MKSRGEEIESRVLRLLLIAALAVGLLAVAAFLCSVVVVLLMPDPTVQAIPTVAPIWVTPWQSRWWTPTPPGEPTPMPFKW